MKHIAMLVGFLGTGASFITYLLFIITQNPWLCCFILAGIVLLLVLENAELLQEVKRKDDDIEVLKTSNSEDLLKQMNGMICEIKALKFEREEQHKAIHILNLKLKHRIKKSGSF